MAPAASATAAVRCGRRGWRRPAGRRRPRGPHAPQANDGVEADAPGVDARRQAVLRDARRTPFAVYTDLEYETARDALGPLARRFRCAWAAGCTPRRGDGSISAGPFVPPCSTGARWPNCASARGGRDTPIFWSWPMFQVPCVIARR